MKPEIEYISNHKYPGTIAYKRFFYKNAFKGVLRKHRVKFKRRRIGRDEHFVLYPHWQKRWYSLFEVPENLYVPFTYSDFARAVGFMKVIDELGVNFKHLLHLKSEMWFFKDLVPKDVYVIDYAFEDVLKIRPDKAAMIGYTAINRDGELHVKTRDHFVIKKLPKRDSLYLQEDTSNEFKGISRVPAELLENSRIIELFIPSHLAIRYGYTSGDLVSVHTTPYMATLFGFDRPFIQGLCTANLIISRLCMAGIHLQHFTITFARPVYIRSTVYLYFNDKGYRLQDKNNNVLCFGEIN